MELSEFKSQLVAIVSHEFNNALNVIQTAASVLRDRGFDVEILERHHRFKKDSPSGTALHFARIVQEAMGQTELRHGRQGMVGERPAREIGVHAVRVGDNVGEHTILFSTLGETLELTHRAHARDCYVRGALQAAKYLANRPAGWYSMNDVLGLPEPNARQRLESLGLRVGLVRITPPGRNRPGTVTEQRPAPGSMLLRGGRVDLTVTDSRNR